MTKEQKQFRLLILADLKLVRNHYNDDDKAIRLQAAYHMQQAIEKTIKLKAEIEGLNLWGHDIDVLIRNCDKNNIDIGIPKLIRTKADMYTHWESECRYYPAKVARKDSIKNAYDATAAWLAEGKTRL